MKRKFSMRPDIDRMLVAHVERTPGAALSSAGNAALLERLESAAVAAYRQWDTQAGPEERDALAAFAAHDEKSLAAE